MLVDEGGELLEVDIDNSIFFLILTNLTLVGFLILFQLFCTAFNLLKQFLALAVAFQEIWKKFF